MTTVGVDLKSNFERKRRTVLRGQVKTEALVIAVPGWLHFAKLHGRPGPDRAEPISTGFNRICMSDDVSSQLGDLTELYLPPKLWGAMEARLLRASPTLAAEIMSPEEINKSGMHRPSMAGVDVCGRNLTRGLGLDMPLYFCVTRARTVNAMIARCPGFYGVAIAEGVHTYFNVAMAALLSYEPLARFVEDGIEPDDDHEAPARSRREAWLRILADAGDRITSRSLEITSVLSLLAMYFLMAHEIGHLALGHLPLFSEGHATETDSDAPTNAQVSRALERDADAFAAAATVWYTGADEVQDLWRMALRDREAGIRLFMTAAYVLFSIMDLQGPEDSIAHQKTHPAPMVRISSMALLLAGIMGNWGAFTRDEVWEIGRSCTRAVEITTMKLGGGMMEPALARALQEESERAIEQHAELWPELSARLNRDHLKAYFWADSL